jgi:hypothetical protein
MPRTAFGEIVSTLGEAGIGAKRTFPAAFGREWTVCFQGKSTEGSRSATEVSYSPLTTHYPLLFYGS